MVGKLAPRKKNMLDNIIPELNKLLDEKDKIKVSVEE
jgi:RNA-binding protein YhbY